MALTGSLVPRLRQDPVDAEAATVARGLAERWPAEWCWAIIHRAEEELRAHPDDCGCLALLAMLSIEAGDPASADASDPRAAEAGMGRADTESAAGLLAPHPE